MACGCSRTTTSSCSTPTCSSSCSCQSSCDTSCDAICAALVVTNSWNVPACDESAVLYIPGLTTVLIGSYISNPSYGTFKVTGINSVGGKVTITNECLAGNAAPGTVVPAGTTFVFGTPPTLTEYTDWVPVVSAGGAMTVAGLTINEADYFTIGSTAFFEFSVVFTLGGVANPAVYISAPVTGVPKTLGSHALVETSSGVDPGGFWRVDLVTPANLLIGIEGFANWPLGVTTVNISSFYEIA